MNIDKFIATRKAMGFSQQELCDGVCTQATLSRLESNGQVPTIKILIQLCRRLHLSLDDLFPKFGVPESQLNQQLDATEFKLVTSEYREAQALLEKINGSDLTDERQRWRYLYLRGYLSTLLDHPITDSIFDFNQILMAKSQSPLIYNLLAYTGCGIAYARHDQLDKAEFYFNKVFDQIYQCTIETTKDVWRVLNIVYNTGRFYSQSGHNYEIGNELLNYALTICANNHVTYYVAKVEYQLALNGLALKADPAEIIEHIHDSRAFARINRNHIMLAQLDQLQARLDNQTSDEAAASGQN